MKYVSAMAHSETYKKIFNFLQVILILPPMLMIFVVWNLLKSSESSFGELPVQFLYMFLLIIVITIVMIFIFRYLLKHQSSHEVEITSNDVLHLRPGREVHFTWQQLNKAKLVRLSRGPDALMVKWDGGKYTFHPYLIPEDLVTQQKLQIIPYPKWNYIDGNSEKILFTNTYPFKVLQKHRPDLLENFKI